MGVLDEYKDWFRSFSSEWIRINDKQSQWDIEDFPYEIGVDENLTKPHCWKCVTVNKCWFKNEENKKPEHFDYSKYTFGEIAKYLRGLYHPRCHCKELAINVPREKDIKFIGERNKFNDFFKRKKGIFYGLGYSNKDEQTLINFYIDEVKRLYRLGKYEIYKHWQYGIQINITIVIYGKNQLKNKSHEFKTGLFIYPNGKLRIATIFAGGN